MRRPGGVQFRAERLELLLFGCVVGLLRPKALLVGQLVEFLDRIPVVGGHRAREDVVVELADLLAPVLVALLLDEVEHLGEQRRLLGAQHVGHRQVGRVQRVELGREQFGIEFHLLLRRQLLGDLLDEPVDVLLPGPAERMGANCFCNCAARRSMSASATGASSRSAFCQRPTNSAMNSRSSLGPRSASKSRNRCEHQFAHGLVHAHRGIHRRRIEKRTALGLLLDRVDQAALLQGRQHHGRLLFGVLVVELPFGPVLLGTQRDDALHHVQRRRVGRGVGPAGLAHDHLHLGESPQQRVAGLEVVGGLGHRRPRHRHRHVENAPFVQRRHVVDADLGEVVGRQRQGRQRDKRQDLPPRAAG